jgi:hypothetical protein
MSRASSMRASSHRRLQSLPPTLISRSILLTLVLLVVCVEELDGVDFASWQ